jgi:hypothetical protein
MKSQRELLPGLSKVALGLLVNKTSAGGLECELGGMNDVIAPNRSSLRACLIEVNMFVKMNNRLLTFDVYEVVKLDQQWESFISSNQLCRNTIPTMKTTTISRQIMNTRLNVHIS